MSFLTRAGWGADESLRFDSDGKEVWPREFSPVQAVTVHHSATPVADDPRETVRAVYRFHCVERGWGDVGYHLLIDPLGTIYEGRHSGSDLLPVLDRLPTNGTARAVTAGHVSGCNPGNIGICLLGTFASDGPTAPARRSLALTLALLCRACNLDPLGVIEYRNPDSGLTKAVHTISRHRDWLATECPGDGFAGQFEQVRRDVAELMGLREQQKGPRVVRHGSGRREGGSEGRGGRVDGGDGR
ncbi:N-acetylmuramoyl-L-alanine amidase [Streptoalloteichus tenebrarius]|uniref:N-acetylmuramoyl-L-alanine amidase n=1 Tax=Streptoalloteichus tenebrarius (strain ATCC 17920 / DSM 40477 / JCM 4838 / CBS 697.72 / NBRC 16177 / NCIMB 11028 / NRRL B-12390 / A12253. 1 / ISP 5477) TaxID=1933 RepID=A0ABT1HXE2_STRSD|nr:peptidoglycan recognition family protein [Streptoalloteichus tenebrarius]MCP2260060.1 N-acetylmuramoyl-L-alanine amidase [Streptoalloteichus tenebrarius]BFF03817.1 hypothetical protein GCM10020241_54920 [Streptoalloteichus tenebrarius]